jgi:hypothetical protein
MAKYQIYNGTSWVDICDCNTKVLDSNFVWRELNPRDCPVRYWDGSNWCLVVCEGLVCGGSLDLQGEDGAYYIPFTIPVGVISIDITFSPFSLPDGLSIVTSDKVTKLASIGLIGSPTATGGWNTGTSLIKSSFLYNGVSFDNTGSETITFYGEGVGDPPGDGPMTNTDGDTMYNPGAANVAPGLPSPNGCSSQPGAEDTCYTLNYTRASSATEEEVLVQVVGGNQAGTGWTIFNVTCNQE